MAASILVGDDDRVARELLAEVLTAEGHRIHQADGGLACLEIARTVPLDAALVDVQMPDLDGLAVVKELTALQPGVPVLMVTAFATMESAIEALQAGAYDYLSKPFRMEEIRHIVRRTLEVRRLRRENLQYRQELQERYAVDQLVGHSTAMADVYRRVARVAPLDTTILLLGETGTGKELAARAIHYASARAAQPFVVVDCTALPEPLFESEVFGHERGAFTGAITARRGLLESARGGTVFLDEIGELSPVLQAKLLRVLQERAVRRVGGNDVVPVDVRVIAATNRDLRKRVDEGAFREDLYYRLNVVTITMPALRDRPSDVPLLARHFLTRYAAASGKAVPRLSEAALEILAAHDWPGNVRELQHAIEHAVALASSELILPEDLPAGLRPRPQPGGLPESLTLEGLKQWYVQKVLADTAGNKARAAEILGIDRRTLYRMLEREEPGDEPQEEG